MRPLREIKTIAFLFCTQRTQRAQSFYSFSCLTLALEWSQTSLRQESAESLSTPSPLRGTRPCLRVRKWVIALAVLRSPFILSLQVGISLTVVTTPLHRGRARSLEEALNVLLCLVRGELSSSTRGHGKGEGLPLSLISHACLSSYTTHSVLCLIVRRPVSCCHWLVPEPCELPDALCPPGSAYRRCSPALPASCSL